MLAPTIEDQIQCATFCVKTFDKRPTTPFPIVWNHFRVLDPRSYMGRAPAQILISSASGLEKRSRPAGIPIYGRTALRACRGHPEIFVLLGSDGPQNPMSGCPRWGMGHLSSYAQNSHSIGPTNGLPGRTSGLLR